MKQTSSDSQIAAPKLTLSLRDRIFLQKYEFLKKGSRTAWESRLKEQYLSPEELRDRSWKRCKNLLEHAYQKVPFYRKRLDSLGATPDDIRSPGDFEKIPILTRQDVAESFDLLRAQDRALSTFNKVTTGGSTGHPLAVLHPREVPRAAVLWRMKSWWGVGPAASMATLYRESRVGLKATIKGCGIDWPMQRILLDASLIGVKDIVRFVAQYQRLRPRLVHGYVGAMDVLADYLLEKGVELPPPVAVWTTSAPLTRIQAEKFQRAFRAPVFDQYGCCEVFYIAAQCPARSHLHYFEDVRRVEMVDEQGKSVEDGQTGRLIVTDLENYGFPLIRYAVGDYGAKMPGVCECGVCLPLMSKVSGRISDLIQIPNGTVISGEYATTLFDHMVEAIKQFQLYQNAQGALELRVVLRQDTPEVRTRCEEVLGRLASKSGNSVPVALSYLESIPPQRGKLRFVISDYKIKSQKSLV